MIRFLTKKRSTRVDPEHLVAKATSSLESTQNQQHHVNKLSTWLIWRTGENGFGGDFDFTIKPQKIISGELQ